MLFKKNKQTQQQQQPDYGQKFFKAAAFLFLVFILYDTYSSNIKGKLSADKKEKSEEIPLATPAHIDHKVQEAFDKMYKNPEYKKIQDFVNYIEKSVDKQNGTALKTPEGYLLFIPFDMIFKDNAVPDNKIMIKSEETEFYIDYKIVQKILENPSKQAVEQAKSSNIEEIQENLEDAKQEQLIKEIQEKTRTNSHEKSEKVENTDTAKKNNKSVSKNNSVSDAIKAQDKKAP